VPATSAEPESTDLDLVILGSANLDLVAQVAHLPAPGETVVGHSYREYPGGKGLNQAVAAARAGVRVQFWGHLGADAAGEVLRDVVRSEGIDDRFLLTYPHLPTGRAMVWVDDHAENSIVVLPGANHAGSQPLALGSLRSPTSAHTDSGARDASLVAARVVLTQLEVPTAAVEDFLLSARNRGCCRIVNPAPATELSDELLRHCEILIPNEGELATLGGRQRLHDLGVRAVLETRGPEGVRCSFSDDRGVIINEWTQAAFEVDAVDTTGAGDVFCGYFAATLVPALVHGAEAFWKDPTCLEQLRDAVRCAAAAAALAVTIEGAVPSIPFRDHVEQMLNASPQL